MAPTDHLETQWAQAAARAGIPIGPTYSGRKGRNPLAHRIRTERFKTLVILDELHHPGDALSWGRRCARRSTPPGAGLTNAEIGSRLVISPITVRNHVSHILT